MGAIQQIDAFLLPEEYLVRERAAEAKSEYFNGEVVAMAGARWIHNLIAGNVLTRLNAGFAGRPCIAQGSDMKVRIEKANFFRYPDVSALCGPVDFYDDVQDAYCNPALIVEVLSPTTERYDRTDKFGLYRLIDSLIEYLVIAPDRIEVQLFRKGEDGRWRGTIFTERQDVVRLDSVGCEMRAGEIYEKVDLAGGSPAA